jgi:hypothetical protein
VLVGRVVIGALHIMAVVQLRHPSIDGRRYDDRRLAEGKTPMEAMRALKRRLSDVVYWPRPRPEAAPAQRGRPGHRKREGRARKDTWGRLRNPARPARTPAPARGRRSNRWAKGAAGALTVVALLSHPA